MTTARGLQWPIVMAEGKGSALPKLSPRTGQWDQQKVDRVRWGTGCEDLEAVNASLARAGGDTAQVQHLGTPGLGS